MTWRSNLRDPFLAPAGGAMAWLAVVALTAVRGLDLGMIEILFLLAPLVIVPLGFQLSEKIPCQSTSPSFAVRQAAVLACALSAVTSFLIPVRILAALAAVPWLLICFISAVSGLLRIFHRGLRASSQLCFGVGQLYLLVGGIWFVLSRIGLHPLGFFEPIVLLTAVHFHYAGFAAPIIASALVQFFCPKNCVRYWTLNIAVGCVLVGPALLAAGFLLGPRAKLAAVFVLVIGETGLAAWTLAAVGRLKSRTSQMFLALSAASVIAAMLLAGVWAVGEYPLQPMLNIPQMAEVRGTLNAIGFVFCGVFGWTLHMREAQRKNARQNQMHRKTRRQHETQIR